MTQLANLANTNYNGRMKENLFHPSSHMDDADSGALLTALFEAHGDDLFRHALLRISERERAVELTQEVYLRVWKYLQKGETIDSPRSFMYRILNNLIVDEYRKRKSVSLDALMENDENESMLEGEMLRDPIDEMENAVTRYDSKRAVELIAKLPEPYNAVLIARYIDDMSLAEIAKAMHESENAISVRIHRALKKLKVLLEAKP